MKHRPVPLLYAPLLFVPFFLSAEGFRNAAAGAYALGQSGGRFAFIDDATAVTENPANLAGFADTEILFAPSFVHFTNEVDFADGSRARSDDPLKFLPNLHAVLPAGGGRIVSGIGISVPFGLGAEWEPSGAFAPGGILRHQVPYSSELLTVRINPTVAYRVNESLSVAGGLNLMYSRFRLKQFFPPLGAPGGAPLVSAETLAEADMDGWGFGANLAATWDITGKDRLAATWRSEIAVDYSGDGSIGNLTPAARAFGFSENGNARTSIDFPPVFGVAYGRTLTDGLRAEIQFEWVGFSSFDRLDLDFGANNPLFGGGITVPQDWKDSFTAGAGLRYQFEDGLRLHGSYQYFESPVPDGTLSTTIPDADQNAFTVGTTKRWDKWYAGIAYSYVIYDDREATIGGVPARMESRLHLLSLSVGARF
ncbi:MAG: OmpP1/FadL family transporter [Puniceicoccaceae bacterium]